jgi:hypothetical protein
LVLRFLCHSADEPPINCAVTVYMLTSFLLENKDILRVHFLPNELVIVHTCPQ